MSCKDKAKLIIHATNVHGGGGGTLLASLLQASPGTIYTQAHLDVRMKIADERASDMQVRFVTPTILNRVGAEYLLAREATAQDVTLCFGNLPPIFKLRGRVVVFLQNRYLIDDVAFAAFPWKIRLRLLAERLWLKTFMSHADEFVVQTPSMKRLLMGQTDKPVRILPFMAQREEYARRSASRNVKDETEFDFLYVASGEPHKNHRQLIEAWGLLAEQEVYPSLKLTLDEAAFPELCAWLREMVIRHGLKIENLGRLPHEQVLALYKQARALIYPSTFESFGLPLIEARQAGLPILAAELDYVRDVIDPEESFDPSSDVSIARAVKRFLGGEEAPLPLLDAAGFLKQILERVEQSAPAHR